jgi:hypothetical protein
MEFDKTRQAAMQKHNDAIRRDLAQSKNKYAISKAGEVRIGSPAGGPPSPPPRVIHDAVPRQRLVDELQRRYRDEVIGFVVAKAAGASSKTTDATKESAARLRELLEFDGDTVLVGRTPRAAASLRLRSPLPFESEKECNRHPAAATKTFVANDPTAFPALLQKQRKNKEKDGNGGGGAQQEAKGMTKTELCAAIFEAVRAMDPHGQSVRPQQTRRT